MLAHAGSRIRKLVVAAAVSAALVGCGDDSPAGPAGEPAESTEQLYPDVLDVVLTPLEGGTWQVDATLSSPYDTADRYADAWRVLDPDGNELGVRELTHDHADEQPFTRSLRDVEIPDDVTTITVEGRDQQYGWGGDTVEATVPRR